MKKNLLFFIFVALGLNSYCQPGVRIFAFEQKSLPGTIPVGATDENGNPIQKAAANKNYFVFLSFRKNYKIEPIAIMIRNNGYVIRATETARPPVVHTSKTIRANSSKVILVPATKNRVLEIKMGDALSIEHSKYYSGKLSKTNEVVVVYKWNKKKYFATLKKLKVLEPVYNE